MGHRIKSPLQHSALHILFQSRTILDDRNLLPMGSGQDVVEQGGFASAQEAREHGHGHLAIVAVVGHDGAASDWDRRTRARVSTPRARLEHTRARAPHEDLSLCDREEAFVRRYSAETRPFNPFHQDRFRVTVNIALSADDQHGGVGPGFL